MVYHSALDGEDAHGISRWFFSDESARVNLIGADADDIGKVAWQQDNNTFWVLSNHSPLTWVGIKSINFSSFEEDIVPDTDNTRSLGSPTRSWQDVYVGPGSLYVNGQQVISDDSGTIVYSAAEDRSIQIKSQGVGDVELLPEGTGVIQLKGSLILLAGKTVMSSDGNAISFSDDIAMNNNRVTGLPEPSDGSDPATRDYVHTYSSNASNLSSGTVPSNVLPPIAITKVYSANNESAMLALSAQEGDVVVRTDESKSYIHNDGSAGTVADWTELQTPTDTVLSVNGETGTVSLNQDDVGDGSTYVRTENNLTDALLTKLNNIESNATGDMSANEILSALLTVDGASSGLDADLLDGQTRSEANAINTVVSRDAYSRIAVTGVSAVGGGSGGYYIEDMKHQITNNDGGGNFNIRVGNTYSAGCTEAGYAFHDAWIQTTGMRYFYVSSASLNVDDTPTWRSAMAYSPTTCYLNYNGSERLVTTNAGITVTGEVSATSFNATSLREAKENIEEFKQEALEIIEEVEIVSYTFKDDENKVPKVGFIADDTDSLLSTPEHNSMDVTNSIGLLIKSVQELSSKIEDMEKRIQKLENE